MKFKNILLAVLVLGLSMSSCKNEEKKQDEKESPVEAAVVQDEDIVVITLNALVVKDDSFQIYYKQEADETSPFKEEESLYSEFKGSDKAQDIIWKLPVGVLPAMLRFDTGTNKAQAPIVINSFKVSLNGKEFEYRNGDFAKAFMPNEETVKFDAATSTVTPLQLANGGYDPLFMSTIALNGELAKIAQ